MQELQLSEIHSVNGGISQETQIGSQLAIVGFGIGMIAGGVAMAPVAAVAFIGTSVSLTISYLLDNT